MQIVEIPAVVLADHLVLAIVMTNVNPLVMRIVQVTVQRIVIQAVRQPVILVVVVVAPEVVLPHAEVDVILPAKVTVKANAIILVEQGVPERARIVAKQPAPMVV